ncbi:acyl-CoA N-acyltransferase [Kockovaella imperatae]|uniref:Acyl-CoA N-acyltransferase n=1 Tax=Kockovaella imperatae TaxID=4999 RepID=A0A1Y1UK77_9TREE|nr:acyl-CoA N-acyltransferase [Kockovaella imperatae]ORX38399.1 acyl-CoA N-acyltransferase [Kockovaella imperatae]
MSIIRPFELQDVLKFNSINVDAWTATYHTGYYASYLAQWPDFCVAVQGSFDDTLAAYLISKHEPPPPDNLHHGHVTALTIKPEYRGLGLAHILIDMLERLSSSGTDCVDAWFVDLFVRCNNTRAIEMYEKMGYSVFRRVVDYYTGMEGVGSTKDELDGFDMRKSMPKDTTKRHVRSNGRDILVSADQVWA